MKPGEGLKQLFGYRPVRGDIDRLFLLARRLECSEYDIFHQAAAEWNVPDVLVERDFKKYLDDIEIPHYVRDFVRREYGAESDEEEMNDLVRLMLRWWHRRKNRTSEGPS